MHLIGPSIGLLYPVLLQNIMGDYAVKTQPRGFKTRELLGFQLEISDLTQNILVHPVRDLNYRFMVTEWLWIMAGRDDVETLAKYNQEMRRFSDDGETLAGAYGPRLRGSLNVKWPNKPTGWPKAYSWVRSLWNLGNWGGALATALHEDDELKSLLAGPPDQLTWCVQKLREDPDSRQAVATIWTPCPGPSKDVPCTISAQFLLRDIPECHCGANAMLGNNCSKCGLPVGKSAGLELPKHLHAIFTMRSSDAWLGLPYDVFTFSMIANCLAGELKAKPGSLIIQLGSSHLYEQHWEKATELVARWEETETVRSPTLPYLPSCQEFSTMLNPDYERPSTWNQYTIALTQKTKTEALEVLRQCAQP